MHMSAGTAMSHDEAGPCSKACLVGWSSWMWCRTSWQMTRMRCWKRSGGSPGSSRLMIVSAATMLIPCIMCDSIKEDHCSMIKSRGRAAIAAER